MGWKVFEKFRNNYEIYTVMTKTLERPSTPIFLIAYISYGQVGMRI